MKLRAPTAKPIVLKPVRPNAGVQAQYGATLDKWISQMQASIVWWVRAAYRANEPHMARMAKDQSPEAAALNLPIMAADASPARTMRETMAGLARQWQGKFNAGAPELAQHFADKSMGGADTNLKTILKKAGFSVPFVRTRAVNDGYQAVIGENVALIKSIASQHLAEVEGLVMRSVQHGRDLSTLTDELESRYAITRRRAAFIARDQNNKATAVMNRIRQKQLGISKAQWLHSGGGVHPRESHEAVDGDPYETAVGMLIDGEYIQPGELPNCRCVSRSIIPGFNDANED